MRHKRSTISPGSGFTMTTKERGSRRARMPRSREPHIEIIMRLPGGEAVGIWSPWRERVKARAIMARLFRAAATPKQRRSRVA